MNHKTQKNIAIHAPKIKTLIPFGYRQNPQMGVIVVAAKETAALKRLFKHYIA